MSDEIKYVGTYNDMIKNKNKRPDPCTEGTLYFYSKNENIMINENNENNGNNENTQPKKIVFNKINKDLEQKEQNSKEEEVIEKIRENFLKDNINYEICGNFILKNKKIIDYTYNEYSKDSKLCVHDRYTSHIWHTHYDKIYPSYQDILKPLRHDIIKYSYIISKNGYFKIYFNDILDVNSINKFDTNEIIKILDSYYNSSKTLKGRKCVLEECKKLCKNISDYMNKILKTLNKENYQIDFYLKEN
jgi:hypothetical protein